MSGLILGKRISDDGRPQYELDRRRRYVIPGDIHFPQHDYDLVVKYTMELATSDIKSVLFLQGDTGSQDAFSKFPKDLQKVLTIDSMERERVVWADFIEMWLGYFDEIVIGPGNHEARAFRSTVGNPAYAGLGWWWPYGASFNSSRITVLDLDYRATLSGTNINIEHGNKLRGWKNTTCPAAAVAKNYPMSTTIFGHTHRKADVYHTTYFNGNRYVSRAVNVGTLQDTTRQSFANEPSWQPGAAIIDCGKVTLV